MNISDMAKYNIASPETLERISGRFSDSFKSGITDALELKNMRGRFWFIPPGENISTPHKHGVQEEIYYQVKGPGKILFGKGGGGNSGGTGRIRSKCPSGNMEASVQ